MYDAQLGAGAIVTAVRRIHANLPLSLLLQCRQLQLLLLSVLQVADVCVEALVCPAAADKVVEIIAERSAPAYPLQQLFERI